MHTPSPHDPNLRRAHPLAAALIEHLKLLPNARVLEIGAGRGRNTAALTAAGLDLCAIADENVHRMSPSPPPFDGALSTHALLHGTTGEIACIVNAIAQALRGGAPLYATFGSTRDARYGKGTRVDAGTFAPQEGDEAGVAHAYFDDPSLRALLESRFAIEAMEERNVDDVAGSWAHSQRPHGTVHWFVRAIKRQ